MNTIQLGSVTTQVDMSKYIKESISEKVSEETNKIDENEIKDEIPSKGTKQYDELKTTLINARIPITEENIKTVDLMIKSGIEVHKENIEAAVDIKKQLDYIINHVSDNAVKIALNNELSLDKITIDVLENIIRDTNSEKTDIPKTNNVTKEEVKKVTDNYIKENELEERLSKEEIEAVSKCIEKLLQEELPITNKNVQTLVSVIVKSEEIRNIEEDTAIGLLKKDKPITLENIYITKYSSSKHNDKTLKTISQKDWNMLLPQIEKLIEKENIPNKNEAIKVAKLLLNNELPITLENISAITDIKKLKTEDIDTDKLLEEAVKNIKQDKPVADIDLEKIINQKDVKQETIKPKNVEKKIENRNIITKHNQKQINNDTTNVKQLEYQSKEQNYKKIIENISDYDEETIKNAIANSNGELTLKDLQNTYNQTNQNENNKEFIDETKISELTQEQRDKLKVNIEKELKTVTAKRQLAEIRLRLTSEVMTTLMQKGIDIDTMPLKEVIKELKVIENDLYKSQLNIAGAEVSDDNVSQMKDLYDKLASITDLSTSTYKEVIHRNILFTVDGLSEAEEINFDLEQLQLQQASKVYETLQTQPNPKFKESFLKVSKQIEPLLSNLNIESTDENIRAAEILVKNKMEVTNENILDIKLIDSKVTEVTTQLHPTIAANMIKEGLKPAQMHVDEVIEYMNKFKELLGEDLTEKISSYIYDMDKAGEMTEPERETMIGVYRMLYTIQKTQGRATGFVVKNDMTLTLNNLMEASKYYDRTNARYSDIDVKINDDFGALKEVIINEKSIKAQLNKAYEESKIMPANKQQEHEIQKTEVPEQKINEIQEKIVFQKPEQSNNILTEIDRHKQNIINEFIESADIETIAKVIKQYPDIETIPIEKIVNYIKELPQKNNSNINNKLIQLNKSDYTINIKNNISEKINIDEIKEYIDDSKILTKNDKETVLKIYNTFKSIQYLDDISINNVVTKNPELTIENIKKSMDNIQEIKYNNTTKILDDIGNSQQNNITEKVDDTENTKQNNTTKKVNDIKNSEHIQEKQNNKPIDNEIKVEKIQEYSIKEKQINEFIKNSNIQSIIEVIKQHDNIEAIPIEKLVNYIKKLEIQQNKPQSLKSIADIRQQINNKSVKDTLLEKMNKDEVSSYIDKIENITQKDKDIILKIHNVFEILKEIDIKAINLFDSNSDELTLRSLYKSIDTLNTSKNTVVEDEEVLLPENNQQNIIKENEVSPIQQQSQQKDSVNPQTNQISNMYQANIVSEKPEMTEYKMNLINEFIQSVEPEVVTQLVKQYPDIETMPLQTILNNINKIKGERNIKIYEHEILKDINKIQGLTQKNKETILKICNIINDIKNADSNTVNTILQSDTKLTLDNFIKSLNNFGNTQNTIIDDNVKTKTQQPNLQNLYVQQPEQPDYKTIEYEKIIIDKFIQKAQPDMIAKIIKQYPDIENMPIENILKCMETIKEQNVNSTKMPENKVIQKTEEFIRNINQIKNTEPATMLWMQKHDIPLTTSNIQIIQNFMKDPFWFGKEINNFSKEIKEKLGEKNPLDKSISKKDLFALKSGKSVSDILDDLSEEIENIKKEAVKLPQQERQNLWKQSNSLEKAVEMQKQLQKDEYLYQIPIQLHNGMTNMNLYVMNDKQGNGKLSEDDMKVFISLDTETMGAVQVYMKMSEKTVSFQINTENPEATKFLRSQQSILQISIENLGYMVHNMKYGQEEKKNPIKVNVQPQINLTGKNVSKNNGFETII